MEKNTENTSGYSGYALASALSGMVRAGMITEQNEGRVFTIPPSGPPPVEETFPTSLIDWPEKRN